MITQKKYFAFILIIAFSILAVGFIGGCKGKKEEKPEDITQLTLAPDIKERLKQFTPTEIVFNENLLNQEQKQVLGKLLQAAKLIDKIFWKQASHFGLEIKEKLKGWNDPAAEDYLHYLKINFGPYDRLDADKPFIGTDPKPHGAGFYPSDLTKDELEKYVTNNPEQREALEHTYTVVKREDGRLVAVPYDEEYREDLEPIAQLLEEAAEITSNTLLKKYLNQRAQDLLSNDYYQSDCDWIDLEDNIVEIVIGPFEVYEDKLNGLKAAYEAFVYINDVEEMKKIKGYLDFLNEAHSKGVMDSIDLVGLQFYPGYHLNASFAQQEGPAYTPAYIMDTLNRYAKFGKPIHITEFSLPSTYASDWNSGYWKGPWTEALQADYAERIFTLAYANPHVGSITWWDIMDNKPAVISGGLVNRDGSPKESYTRIKDLLSQWWTNTEVQAKVGESTAIPAYSGRHRVVVRKGDVILSEAEVDIMGGWTKTLRIQVTEQTE